jgi:hypothetical protein
MTDQSQQQLDYYIGHTFNEGQNQDEGLADAKIFERQIKI